MTQLPNRGPKFRHRSTELKGMLLIMSRCTKTIPAWVGPRGTQWAASLRMLDHLPESLAGTLVLSSLLLTVHLLQSLKKKKLPFSFVTWKYPQPRSTRRKAKRTASLDSEDQNIHARYSTFPSQTTEETQSSEY